MKKILGVILIVFMGVMISSSAAYGPDNKVVTSPSTEMKQLMKKYDVRDINNVDSETRESIISEFDNVVESDYKYVKLFDVTKSSGLSENQIKSLLPDNLKQLSTEIYNIDNSSEKIRRVNAIYLISQIKIFTGNGKYIPGNNLFGIRKGIKFDNKLKVYNSLTDSLYDYSAFLRLHIVNYKDYSDTRKSVCFIASRGEFPLKWIESTYNICIDLNNQCK